MKRLNLNLSQITEDLHDNSLLILSNTDHYHINSLPKLAIFDLDHTLIKPKAYRAFPVSENDFIYTFKNVKEKLNELHTKNFQIFVVSN